MSQWSPGQGDATPPVPRLRDRELRELTPPPRATYQPRHVSVRARVPLWLEALAMWGVIALVILAVVIFERLT